MKPVSIDDIDDGDADYARIIRVSGFEAIDFNTVGS
jgi:hypothetical protein